jgi:hypothetical protein
MQIYVKEWPNRAATLYTEAGEELWTFPNLESAMSLWTALREETAAADEMSGDIGLLHALIDGRVAA